MADGLVCGACGARIEGGHPNDTVRCPSCGAAQPVPAEPADGEEAPAPYELIEPEDADADGDAPAEPAREPGPGPSETAGDAGASGGGAPAKRRGVSREVEQRLAAERRMGRIVRGAVLAGLLLAAAGLAYGWRVGPGDRLAVRSARRVRAVVASRSLGVVDPMGLGIGGASGGAKALEKLGIGSTSTRTVGGEHRLIVVATASQGGHVLVELAVSQRLLVERGFAEQGELRFTRSAFRLRRASGGEGVKAEILSERLKRPLELNLALADTRSPRAMLPAGPEPSTLEREAERGTVSQRGRVAYEGVDGVEGTVRFESGAALGGVGKRGFSAKGNVVWRPAAGMALRFRYRGDALRVVWPKAAQAFVAKDRIERAQDTWPFAKHALTLLFPVPPKPGPYELLIGDEPAGRIRLPQRTEEGSG